MANAAKESTQGEFSHGLLEFCTKFGRVNFVWEEEGGGGGGGWGGGGGGGGGGFVGGGGEGGGGGGGGGGWGGVFFVGLWGVWGGGNVSQLADRLTLQKDQRHPLGGGGGFCLRCVFFDEGINERYVV